LCVSRVVPHDAGRDEMAKVPHFVRETAKQFVPPETRQKIRDRLFRYSVEFDHYTRENWPRPLRSYSQFGEDMVAKAFFEAKKVETGFYVDVGAHSPIFMSNTYYFYKRGWRGINIEPTPGRIRRFQKTRPRDVNLELAISPRDEELTFFVFDAEELMNTADPRHAEICAAELKQRPKQVKVKAKPLRDVLAEHLAPGSKIDLMSVDVEGFDAEVLRSNDWAKYRPDLLMVECLVSSIEEVQRGETAAVLDWAGYRLYAWAPKTAFFVPREEGSA
jgi:FkbM family methyltransferase